MGRLPAWDKGMWRRCAICGFEYPERSGKLFKRGNILVDDACYDKLLEIERQTFVRK